MQLTQCTTTMQLFPDAIFIICLCACIVIYLLFKFLNSRSSFVTKKHDLLERFQNQRTKSVKLQEALNQYILSEPANSTSFIDNMSHREYLKYLQKNHIQYLSEKNYIKLKNSNNRILFSKTSKMLVIQNEKLNDAAKKLAPILNNTNFTASSYLFN